MELGNTVRAVRAAGKAGAPARALVRLGAAVLVSLAFPSKSWGASTARNPPSGESVCFAFVDGEPLGRPDPGFHVPMLFMVAGSH